ncbi:MAG: YebC/PmpR family DNA-binding transcriptional regulator, partial [Acidimicrobiia bacterium]|nr:YebC/PmpR family DNA-binding transcriptional regulator [Acidimicrobiia bacterium]
MSGHSKWATIKRKKAVIDQKRGKTFAKLARQIDVAARQGGGDPAANAPLRTIIQKAKAAQMTNDAIDRAIKRATGEAQGANYEAITYEAYAPGGVALLIDILTDNRNRTASDVRAIFSKNGGAMAAPGAVAWQFSRKGVILVDRQVNEDELMNAVLEHGADDMADDGSVWRVTCDATKVYEVK